MNMACPRVTSNSWTAQLLYCLRAAVIACVTSVWMLHPATRGSLAGEVLIPVLAIFAALPSCGECIEFALTSIPGCFVRDSHSRFVRLARHHTLDRWLAHLVSVTRGENTFLDFNFREMSCFLLPLLSPFTPSELSM